jgi:hypothetical protein
MEVQLAPRSVVWRSARQMPVEHGTSPNTKPSSADMKLADCAKKPEILNGVVVVGGPVVGGTVVSELEGDSIMGWALGAAGLLHAAKKLKGSTIAATTSRRTSTMCSRPPVRVR